MNQRNEGCGKKMIPEDVVVHPTVRITRTVQPREVHGEVPISSILPIEKEEKISDLH